MFVRDPYKSALSRLKEPRRFIQVLAGPRQVGKTTLAQQLMTALPWRTHYASADEPSLHNRVWIEQQWELGRLLAKEIASEIGTLLVLDEVQKVIGWSETVKRLWDEDTRAKLPLKVILLGSSPLLMQHGLTESLAGRFEIIPITHWSFAEMQQAFGFNLEQYIFFGGYPGAAPLINDQTRWANYIRHSLIETTVSRDILLMTQVKKPALLRKLFQLGCDYSGQILSYQKMVGQLQDAGNTTTLAHYLELLESVGMLRGIQKYSKTIVKQRASSPKLQVLNTALITAQTSISFEDAKLDRDYWGRLVESAVGAYLLNSLMGKKIEIFYWRERGKEVDFILQRNKKLIAIEVKSGRKPMVLPGIQTFKEMFKPYRILLVGEQGIPLSDFLQKPVEYWFT